jgi:sugar lactone lactonase YvrE
MKCLGFFLPALASTVLLIACGGGGGTGPNASVLEAGGSALQPHAAQSPSLVVRTQARSASCLTHTCIYSSGGVVVNGSTIVPSLGVFRARANGNVAKVQTISGNKTDLNLPGVAVDARHNIYAAADSTVTVYAPGSNGNVRPLRTISGSKTGLDAHGIAVDARGKIYVVNSTSITEYAAGSNGNVKPSHVISGPRTGLDSPNGIAVDARNNIYVMNSPSSSGGTPAVTVYAAGAHGNVAPIQTIAGPSTKLIYPLGIAVDSTDAIYVTSCAAPSRCGIGTSEGALLVFAPGANGNVAPIRAIEGQNTGLAQAGFIALDASANIYVTQYYSNYNGSCIMAPGAIIVFVFAAGANGNTGPIQEFQSADCTPAGVAVR